MSGVPASGLIAAYDIGADATVRQLPPNELSHEIPSGGWRWIHLQRTADDTRSWLVKKSGIGPMIADALL